MANFFSGKIVYLDEQAVFDFLELHQNGIQSDIIKRVSENMVEVDAEGKVGMNFFTRFKIGLSENYIFPKSFISNNPNENQSHFIFCLFEGVDGSYKLLLLVYLKNIVGNYYLEVIDRVDALNKNSKDLQQYYDQFKKCEQYLSENKIIIS